MTTAETRPAAPGFAIADREIGGGRPAFVIAEVGQAHDGSLGAAHAYIDAVADAGVDAIKFQTHIAAAESTLDEPFRVRFSRQDETRYAYWRRMEFTEEQWAGLAEHCRARGLVFLSSAFSVAAVELLARLGMPAWKIGSGEYRSDSLIEAMLAAGGPILLSSGMSRLEEIGEAVEGIRGRGGEVAVFQCTSRYPTPLEAVGLNLLPLLRERFRCPVGLSDHSGLPYPALAAFARGVELFEAHVIFDKRMFGPDTPASLTVEQFAELIRARDAFATLDAHPVDKDAMAEELAEMRRIFTKSVAVTAPLPAGHRLAAADLTVKKPGSGIPAAELESLVGRRLAQAVAPERLLTWNDIE